MHHVTVPFYFFAAVAGVLTRYRLAFDGGWQALDAIELPLDTQYACFHPSCPWLYVLCSNGGVARAGDRHALVTLRLDGPCMEAVGVPVALPFRPIHAAFDARGGRLLVAYNRPAALTVHPLDDEGRPETMQEPVTDPAVVGHFPHQVLPMPHGQGMLLVCRGDDATPTQAENPGSLRVLDIDGTSNACTQVIAPQGGLGFGPRNGVFGPSAAWLQVVLERQNVLATFGVEHGKIEAAPRFTQSLLQRPDASRKPQLAGAIELDTEGRFAYVVNRSHAATWDQGCKVDAGGENSIVVFSLDAETGRPQRLQTVPLAGLHARCISLSPDGLWLVAAIRESSVRLEVGRFVDQPAGLQCFRVQRDGQLVLSRHIPLDDSAGPVFWAGFAPTPPAAFMGACPKPERLA